MIRAIQVVLPPPSSFTPPCFLKNYSEIIFMFQGMEFTKTGSQCQSMRVNNPYLLISNEVQLFLENCDRF